MEKARSEYVCELSKWLNIYLNGIKDQEACRGSLGPFPKKKKKLKSCKRIKYLTSHTFSV